MDYDDFYYNELAALGLQTYYDIVKLVMKTTDEIMKDLNGYDLGTMNGIAIVPTSFGGYLDSNNKQIVVDSTDTDQNIKNTIAHEVRHLYQRVLVKMMVDGTDTSKYEDIETLKRWYFEMTNKVNHAESTMEKDAFEYGNNRYVRN
jgi:hypothetical protein